jgi:outer membrane protein TolC
MLLCGIGCTQLVAATPLDLPTSLPQARLAAPGQALSANGSQKSSPRQNGAIQEIPPPRELPSVAPAPKVMLINLDTVLRLAQDQNVKVNLAREKLQDAFAGKELADKAWLPDLLVGPSYWRHEGGIANEDGTLTRSSFGSFFAGFELNGRLDLREAIYQKVDAERKIWQQRGEVSRMTAENLLDAASTYVDLLAARQGEAVALEVEGNLKNLLSQAQKMAATDPGARVEVDRVASQLSGQKQILRKVREGTVGASAKLAYLLGLEPCTELLPTESRLVPFNLVDASQPACDLVNQALANGPGVREMEGLLNLINSSLEKAQGCGKFIPILELRVAEGGFGTGPGDSMLWDNRLDIGIHARWNLTELTRGRERMHQAQSKLAQVQLGYQDLRGRLTMGVQESREASRSGADQIQMAREQIEHARAAYKLSNVRLTEGIKGASPSEVLLSIQALGLAQLNYLQALRDFDKAQLRLMVLLGSAGHRETAPR